MHYEAGELAAIIWDIFHPEPIVGNEGAEYHEMRPLDRLATEYKLDTSYWRPFEYGASSDLMRRTDDEADGISAVVQAQQVPFELFMGTFRLLGDSIVAYHLQKKRIGPYRYYPAILMSAWASFEAFVRVYSELLVKTVPSLPGTVQQALLECEEHIDARGQVLRRKRLRPLLDRYYWLLKFGYGIDYDRGSRVWQLGKSALNKRNNLVHYEIADLPSVKASDLWQHLESILLLLIGPSTQIGLTVMPDQYELHNILFQLQPLIEEFEEQPHFKDIPLNIKSVAFPCPFRHANPKQYPTVSEYSNRFRK